MVRNDERFLDNVVANMQMTIIKAEIREIYIIIDEGFHLLFRPVSEENIGKAGLFNSSTFSINQFYTGQGWIEGDNVVLYKIIVGFFLTAVCGAQSIPVGTRQRISGGHPCW